MGKSKRYLWTFPNNRFEEGKAKGASPCQELSAVSPQPGAQKQAQDNFPLALWCVFLRNGLAKLKLSFAFCLRARRFPSVLVPFLLVTFFVSRWYFLAPAKVKKNHLGPQISASQTLKLSRFLLNLIQEKNGSPRKRVFI